MKRILIIDDEPGICQVVQVAFKVITQWQVLVANSSQAGIAIAEAEQPDAILLDVMMPEVDGVSTVEIMWCGGGEAPGFLGSRGSHCV